MAESLLNLIDTHHSGSRSRAAGRGGWHVHAHALVALARTSPSRAAAIVRRDVSAELAPLRVYAIRAATVLRDTATLLAASRDPNGNVREAALSGLAAVAGHRADSVYRAALASADYHVVLEAATALRGAPDGASHLPALLDALDRLSAERSAGTHCGVWLREFR
jgi:hypothetical protein